MAGLLWAVPGFLLANRLLPVALQGRSDWEVRVFFGAWLLSLLHALFRRGRKAWIEQLLVAALLLALVPLVSALTTDHGLLRSIEGGDWAMAGVDLTAFAAALLLLWMSRKLMKKVTLAKRKPALQQADVVLESEASR
jgi:protein-S-isoprenylcysteine O-methyltransferase Ste14